MISKEPRKVRIEVGYGLEGAITDGFASQVNKENLVPRLKRNDYDQGVISAYHALAKKTAEEYKCQIRNSRRY